MDLQFVYLPRTHCIRTSVNRPSVSKIIGNGSFFIAMKTPNEILNFAKNHKKDLWYWYLNYRSEGFDFQVLNGMKRYEINAALFVSISTKYEFCKILNISDIFLNISVNYPKYEKFIIPKKRNGNREIYAPNCYLKAAQAKLSYFLQAYYECIRPRESYGFVLNINKIKGFCNIAENAKQHVGKKYLLNIDLKDFFSNILGKQVYDFFSSSYFNFPKPIVMAMTLFTIFEGKLPTGAPTSPVISNLICLELDAVLSRYSSENEMTYSRYADDLSFSSDSYFTEEKVSKLISLIESKGFIVNNKKVYQKAKYQKQVVTGLVVNEKVNIDRKLLKKIRAMLHDLEMNGIENAAKKHFGSSYKSCTSQSQFLNRLEGYINFVGQIRGKEDVLFLKMKSTFEFLKKKQDHQLTTDNQ